LTKEDEAATGGDEVE
ncbi:unnamed protein product, partial [Diplocarpon coronariae]